MSRRGGSGRRTNGGRAVENGAMNSPPAAPADARTVLEAVAANPGLRSGAHVVLRDLIEKGIAGVQQPVLRQYMAEAFSGMLQGKGPDFTVLQGGPLAALSGLQVEADGVVLPETAWSQDALLGCLAEVATNSDVVQELSQLDHTDAILSEMSEPMAADQLHSTFEVLLQYRDSTLSVGSVIRMLVQLAQLNGPLKMLGGPPTPCDLQTFSQHLSALANQLNTLHDPKLLGEYLQSPFVSRDKYELFALQHVQMLVWLQRVQQGLSPGMGKTGAELTSFVSQISHAARVLLFQPMLLHGAQVMRYLHTLPKEPVADSMREAMRYPSDTASDADRVAWLQLNLLLQFQSLYRTALCDNSIYTPNYSPGEANLFSAFLRLEEIYTHLIGRFPACCPLTEQEQAVLTQLCNKLNSYFADGKKIKSLLESQPSNGKQQLVQLGIATNAATAVRDWILPFMMQFADLLKVLWTLWTALKRKQEVGETHKRAVEQIGRLVGNCIVQQLAEEEAALRSAAVARPSDAVKDLAVGRARRPAGADGGAIGEAPQGLPPVGIAGLPHGSSALAPAQSRAVGAPPASADDSNGIGEGGGGWASVVRRPPTEPQLPLPASSKASSQPVVSTIRPKAAGTTDETVRTLVDKREQARFARDFEAADKLREQLAKLGVSLDDQVKVWRASDGRSGPITPVNVSALHAQKAAKGGAAPLTDEDIGRLVQEREQARYTGDYKTADKLRDTLEKHGVHLDAKENKWQAADGRSGPIGPVNISAAHAQKAARAGAPKLPLEEIEKILVQREQARARRDYKTADVLRDTLEKHGVYLDSKENKWHAADGRSGAIVVSSLSEEEIGKILANRQAARLRHDYKTADRLRDQLNEQCVSVDDKKNRWDASDGRTGTIDPFTCVHDAKPAEENETQGNGAPSKESQPQQPQPFEGAQQQLPAPGAAPKGAEGLAALAAAKGDGSKRQQPPEKRREMAKQLRAATGASARMCEKALQSHQDDIHLAADWLLTQSEADGGDASS